MTRERNTRRGPPPAKETHDIEAFEDWLRRNPAPEPRPWEPPPEPGWTTRVRPPGQDLPAPWEPFAGAITADREVVFWRRRLSGGA